MTIVKKTTLNDYNYKAFEGWPYERAHVEFRNFFETRKIYSYEAVTKLHVQTQCTEIFILENAIEYEIAKNFNLCVIGGLVNMTCTYKFYLLATEWTREEQEIELNLIYDRTINNLQILHS